MKTDQRSESGWRRSCYLKMRMAENLMESGPTLVSALCFHFSFASFFYHFFYTVGSDKKHLSGDVVGLGWTLQIPPFFFLNWVRLDPNSSPTVLGLVEALGEDLMCLSQARRKQKRRV